MKLENHSLLIAIDALLANKLQILRGEEILLDEEAAAILEINLQQLQRKVRENFSRFPEEFMLQLTKSEKNNLLPNTKRKKVYAFTWGGLMMLAGLTNTKRAIEIHLQLVRCYGKGIFNKIGFGI